jgi:hypothetical protein
LGKGDCYIKLGILPVLIQRLETEDFLLASKVSLFYLSLKLLLKIDILIDILNTLPTLVSGREIKTHKL